MLVTFCSVCFQENCDLNANCMTSSVRYLLMIKTKHATIRQDHLTYIMTSLTSFEKFRITIFVYLVIFIGLRQNKRSCCSGSRPITLKSFSGTVKLKFHWDQFPRNFPVANVTEKSPTSYGEVGRVGRVASLLRGS